MIYHYLCFNKSEQIMTPLQIQKYSDEKKGFKRDIVIPTKNATKKARAMERIQDIKQTTNDFKEVVISNQITVFFYNP